MTDQRHQFKYVHGATRIITSPAHPASHNIDMDTKMERKELTDMQIGYAVGASDDGMSQREIARRLNCSQSTISRATKDITIDALIPRPKRPGAPRRTSVQDNRLLVRTAIKERKITLQDITNIVGVSVSRSRRLNETGVKSYAARQKPFLQPEHIAKRLEWALEHLHWTVEDWARVI
jgi:hypothetical protein